MRNLKKEWSVELLWSVIRGQGYVQGSGVSGQVSVRAFGTIEIVVIKIRF